MTLDNQLLTISDNTNSANDIKELILNRLYTDGLLNNDQYDNYLTKWQIIIIKRSWFKYWWSKLYNNTKDCYIYKFVKFEN